LSLKNSSNIFIKRFIVGPLGVNAYLVADAAAKEACLIDPGDDAGKIKDFITENGFDLKFIINTHGHGDHIGANGSFKVPIYIHSLDKDFLTDPSLNLSRMFFFSIKSPPAAKLLYDGDVIRLGSLEFKVIHTPGHTPGSITLILGGIAFTGDTLFRSSVGRTDFDYGSEEALFESIKTKLMALSDNTVVYPGHGEPSTIGEERANNPFLE
jgi:glyoxylase-like metal-dependent hydrolase (beta-lactamase superfamily II)